MAVKSKPVGALRRVLRKVGGIASLALAPLLVLQLGVAWFLWNGAVIAVPDFARDPIARRLADNGLACTWSEASVSLSGRISLTDAKVSVAGSDDPVIEVGRLVTVLDVFDLVFSGKITPRRLWLDRGKLLCPAAISPTGRSEVALDDIHASLFMEGNRLVTETLQARCFGTPLVAQGRLLPHGGVKTSGGAPTALPLRAPGLAAAHIVALRPWLSTMENASLELTGEDTSGAVRLTLDGLAGAIHLPGAEVGRTRIRFGALWDASGPHPDGRASFIVSDLNVRTEPNGAVPEFTLKSSRVYVGADFKRDWKLPDSILLTAHRLEVSGYPADRLRLFFDWSAKPLLRLDARALWRDQKVGLRATVDADTGESKLDFDALVRPSQLPEYPAYPKGLPAEIAALKISGDAALSGTVKLDKRASFETAFVSVEAGRAEFGEIDVQSLRTNLEVRPGFVRATGIDGIAEVQRVQGTFESGFTPDARYRLLLRGSAFPGQVAPFVGKWWTDIWKDLSATPGYPVYTDIEVDGRWSGQPYEFIFGTIRARKLAYRKQVFDRATVRVFEEPSRLCIYDMNVGNPDGTGAAGRLEWRRAMPSYDNEGVRFLFKGKLPLATAAELGGADVVEALSDIRVERPAEASVLGYYPGPASDSPGRDRLEVHVDSQGPFEAWKVPGENFSGTVLLDGKRIQVKDARFGYAGGLAKAGASVHRLDEGFRITFDTAFEKCDRAGFFAGLAKLKTPKPGDKPAAPAKPPEEPVAKTELSGDFRGRIALPDTDTLDGSGHIALVDPALFKLPLFGVISKGFEKVGVNFGNYEFRSADSEFFVRKGAAYFPKLMLRGPKAEVKLQGRYELTSDKLFFRALLQPKTGDIPLLSWALSLPGRTTKLFPVDIRGTLEKPEWSVDPTISALFEEQRDDSIGLPPPEEPMDDKW